jgi:hypothetical protein
VTSFVGDLLSKGAKDPLAVEDLNELIKCACLPACLYGAVLGSWVPACCVALSDACVRCGPSSFPDSNLIGPEPWL